MNDSNEDTWEDEGGALATPEPRETGVSVLVVSSEPSCEAGRDFRVESPEPSDAPELPAHLASEAELVKAMESQGYRLNMVGGGSRIDEVRRFYFRKLNPPGESSA